MRKALPLALAALLAFSSCATSRVLTKESPKPLSPAIVGWSALIPGLPQVLNGDLIKGLLVASIAFGGASLNSAVLSDESGNPKPGMEPAVAAAGLAAGGAWIFSYFDGVGNAQLLNNQWLRLNPQFILRIGMTESQLIEIRGRPSSVNRTVLSGTVSEQWVYRSSRGDEYFYFENGVLTAWQD